MARASQRNARYTRGIDSRGVTAVSRGELSRASLAQQYRAAAESGYALPNIGADTPATSTVAPVVSGTARVGFTLTSTAGTFTGTPVPSAVTYQWLRNGFQISGANASTYTCVAADLGAIMSCLVRRENIYRAATRESNRTVAVIAA